MRWEREKEEKKEHFVETQRRGGGGGGIATYCLKSCVIEKLIDLTWEEGRRTTCRGGGDMATSLLGERDGSSTIHPGSLQPLLSIFCLFQGPIEAIPNPLNGYQGMRRGRGWMG